MAYNLVDSLWIGNLLGEQAYAALTNSTPIILILTSIGMGATNGLAILLSQELVRKMSKRKEYYSYFFFCIYNSFSVYDNCVGDFFRAYFDSFKYTD